MRDKETGGDLEVAIVIPAYNEELLIERTAAVVGQVLDRLVHAQTAKSAQRYLGLSTMAAVIALGRYSNAWRTKTRASGR